jgi:hypothetical protein
MNHLMRYEGYSSSERMDDVLDKISKYGISSLTQLEKEFLDSHKSGSEKESHDKISKEESETIFEDDYFKFEFETWEDYGDEQHFIGTLYVPDLELPDGKIIEGRLEGKIIKFENGNISPDFYSKDGYDAFEFCNGLEYELDSFIDYVIAKIEEKYKYED